MDLIADPPIPYGPCVKCGRVTNELACVYGVMHYHCYMDYNATDVFKSLKKGDKILYKIWRYDLSSSIGDRIKPVEKVGVISTHFIDPRTDSYGVRYVECFSVLYENTYDIISLGNFVKKF